MKTFRELYQSEMNDSVFKISKNAAAGDASIAPSRLIYHILTEGDGRGGRGGGRGEGVKRVF